MHVKFGLYITDIEIYRVFKRNLWTLFYRWPSEGEKRAIADIYDEAKNFPGVIGMIDGCHIPVKRPKSGGAMYYNRKDFYSIVLQGENCQDQTE